MEPKRENAGYFLLTLLSPVHIGCDEAYEPTGFCVDGNGGHLTVFDPFQYISDLSDQDRKRFSEICLQGTVESLLDIYKFIHTHPGKGREVEACKGFFEHHGRVLKLDRQKVKNELNKFEIHRTAYNSLDQRPYVPGSAVKGALRTGFLSELAEKRPDYSRDLRPPKPAGKKGRKEKFDEGKVLTEKLLQLDRCKGADKMSKDPFRLIKVSDFMPVGPARTRVLYAINKKKKPTEKDSRGIPRLLEIVQPSARFVGEIKSIPPQENDAVSFALDLDDLLEAANSFFVREFSRESGELQAIGANPPSAPENDATVRLRIGRHSGAESVTVKRYRDIKIMQGKRERPRFLDHATTFWLASQFSNTKTAAGLTPFGWCMLARLSKETAQALMDEAKEHSETVEKKNAPLSVRDTAETKETSPRPEPPQPIAKSPVEKLLDELAAIKSTDMGRLGTVKQKIDGLETAAEKAEVASALKEKIGKKAFKKSKWKPELLAWIEAGGKAG